LVIATVAPAAVAIACPRCANQFTLPRTVLAGLLTHAASAARILGNLDDASSTDQLADHVDAIVHGLSELLGDPGAHAAPGAVAHEDLIACDGALMLMWKTGGAQ
jgi:hypothetical protein